MGTVRVLWMEFVLFDLRAQPATIPITHVPKSLLHRGQWEYARLTYSSDRKGFWFDLYKGNKGAHEVMVVMLKEAIPQVRLPAIQAL
ncbi:hypothetical protein ACXYMU_03430 [Pontibacter sp. CAU 1760]